MSRFEKMKCELNQCWMNHWLNVESAMKRYRSVLNIKCWPLVFWDSTFCPFDDSISSEPELAERRSITIKKLSNSRACKILCLLQATIFHLTKVFGYDKSILRWIGQSPDEGIIVVSDLRKGIQTWAEVWKVVGWNFYPWHCAFNSCVQLFEDVELSSTSSTSWAYKLWIS